MTCIIGLVVDDKVYMGCDSAAAGGWVTRVSNTPKMFKVGPFLIGYTTSFRMGQILQYHLEVKSQGDASDTEYIVRDFIEAVRDCLKEHGFSRVDNNVESGGEFLVGYKGHLYTIDSDFQANEMADGLDACGCGEQFALGAMKALAELPPRERIRRALEISDYFSNGVCGPFHILEG